MTLFTSLQDKNDVARHLACSLDFLAAFSSNGPRAHYLEMHLRKKSRQRRAEYRIVFKVMHRSLAVAQKELAKQLTKACPTPEHVHGFIKGRSIVTNARKHLGAPFVVRADIENFFEMISTEMIGVALQNLGTGAEAASVIAELCSIDGHLVQGASSSPAIANLVCTNLDTELVELANSTKAVYTRYCDDLTFSGSAVPSKQAIAEVIGAHGFSLADHKYRTQRRGKAQYVTGLCVSDTAMPRAPRRMKRWLRAVVHRAGLGLDDMFGNISPDTDPTGFESAVREIARIDGSIAFLYGVEKEYARKLDAVWLPAIQNSSFGAIGRRLRRKVYAPPIKMPQALPAPTHAAD